MLCFGKGGEIINQYCQKGKPASGRRPPEVRYWEDKQGGGKRSKHTVVVENFQLLGGRDSAMVAAEAVADIAGGGKQLRRRNAGYEGDPAPKTSAPPARPPPAPTAPGTGPRRPAASPPAEAPFGEEQQFKEDDIPF